MSDQVEEVAKRISDQVEELAKRISDSSDTARVRMIRSLLERTAEAEIKVQEGAQSLARQRQRFDQQRRLMGWGGVCICAFSIAAMLTSKELLGILVNGASAVTWALVSALNFKEW